MKLIKVGGHNKGSKTFLARIDDSDYYTFSQYNWVICNGYAGRIKNMAGQRKIYLMHRELLDAQKGHEVDHVDMDILNNQRKNLRIVTRAQNMWNLNKSKMNTSGHRGVSWHKHRKKWRAYIKHSNKQIHLGFFLDKEEAAQAYNAASAALRGEFARLD